MDAKGTFLLCANPRQPDFNPPDIFVTLFGAQRDRRHAAMCAGLMGLWGT
jgi:hypothetical protein